MKHHLTLAVPDNKARSFALSSFAVLLALLLTTMSAFGHELRPAVADISLQPGKAELSIDLTLEPLLAGIDQSAIADTNDSPLADAHDALRALEPGDITAAFTQAWPQIANSFNLAADGAPVALELLNVTADAVGNVELPRDATITLAAELPADASSVTFAWDAANGAIALRHVGVEAEGAYEGFLTAGAASAEIPVAGASREAWIVEFTNWIASGFEHIIPKGWDHILFVLGLFFFSLQMRPLLWQVSAFTVAHTFTLALATLGIVQISGAIVEPLIAASIVYVAVENIFVRKYNAWRTVIVFGFGLLHGLGFASVLGDVGLDPGRLLTGLIGFNIGVEVGQLAVIAGAYIAVGWWAGNKPWYRSRIANPASLAIALVGAYWFIERTLL